MHLNSFVYKHFIHLVKLMRLSDLLNVESLKVVVI